MKNKYLLPLLVALLPITGLHAQVAVLNGLAQKTDQGLVKFHENYPQEKVYLQTDRNYYAVGETVWMKAWVTLDGKPSYLSRILYVDLINGDGFVVDKKMYKLDSSGASAFDLQLKNDLVTGNYNLRAYTLWMLNFPDFVFSSDIYVLGIDRKPGSTAKQTPQVTVNFFPEGGELVNDLESVIAFKSYDNYGNPVAVTGTVTDASGKAVAAISTDHDGMGTFRLTPAANQTYTANLTPAKGPAIKVKLPVAKPEGIVMRINNNAARRLTVILQRKAAQESLYNRLLIVAQMHNTTVFQGEVNFAEGASAASIPKKALPPGIIQVTVFDSLGNPLTERLAFVKNTTVISPELVKGNVSLTAKAKNTVSIDLKDVKKPNISVCVTDISADNLSAPVNIVASSLLASDLKGIVNDPNYYFTGNDTAINKHLDVLMMTHGWRRFVWKDMLADKFPDLRFPVESSLSIRGKAVRPGTNNKITDGHVNLILKAKDSTTLMSNAKLTDKGEFIIDDLFFRKDATISYQAINDKKEAMAVDVSIYPNYIDSLKKAPAPYAGIFDYDPIKGNDRLNESLLDQVRSVDTFMKGPEYLAAVTVKARKLSPADSLNNAYTAGPFMFGGRRLAPGNTGYFSLWQLVRTVPGFVVEGDMKNPTVSLSRTAGLGVFSDNSGSANGDATFAGADGTAPSGGTLDYVQNGIAFFLNEVPISRDVLDNLSMADVAFIKTYVGAESFAIGPYHGVISVYTNKGVSRNILDKSFSRSMISGYAPVREYFAPDYSLNPSLQSMPDNRITLLWNPHATTDKQGKVNIKFFNNDKSKKVKVLIQGLDADGRFIYREQVLE